MARVLAKAPDPSIPHFPGIFTLLEDRGNTTPRLRLKRLETFPLGERPPLVVCLEAPDPDICVLWGAQFVTLSSAQPNPKDGKVLDLARDFRLSFLPATVVVQPEWITLGEVTVPQAVEMEILMSRLAPVHLRLPPDTPRTDRLSVPQASLAPLSLVRLLMVSPFLAPETAWHMMHKNPTPWG